MLRLPDSLSKTEKLEKVFGSIIFINIKSSSLKETLDCTAELFGSLTHSATSGWMLHSFRLVHSPLFHSPVCTSWYYFKLHDIISDFLHSVEID